MIAFVSALAPGVEEVALAAAPFLTFDPHIPSATLAASPIQSAAIITIMEEDDDYERQRQETIRQNKELLASLGLNVSERADQHLRAQHRRDMLTTLSPLPGKHNTHRLTPTRTQTQAPSYSLILIHHQAQARLPLPLTRPLRLCP